MPQLIDKSTGQPVNIADGDMQMALSSGAFAPTSNRVNVNIPGKGLMEVDASAVPELVKTAGAELETPEQANDRAMQAKHGEGLGNELRATGEAALRGASLGLSDQVLRGLGVEQEGLRERKERNTAGAVGGEIAGSVLPLFLSSGASELGTGARALEGAASIIGAPMKFLAAAGGGTEKAVLSALTKSMGESAAKRVIAKFGARAASGAVEGAIGGAGHLVSEDALGDAQLNGESLAIAMGTGALLGGATSGVLGAAGDVVGTGISKGAAAIKEKLGSGEIGEALDTFAERQAVKSLNATQGKIAKLQDKDRLEEVGRDLLNEHEVLGGKSALHATGDLEATASNIGTVKEHAGQMKGDALDELHAAAEGIGSGERDAIEKQMAEAGTSRSQLRQSVHESFEAEKQHIDEQIAAIEAQQRKSRKGSLSDFIDAGDVEEPNSLAAVRRRQQGEHGEAEAQQQIEALKARAKELPSARKAALEDIETAHGENAGRLQSAHDATHVGVQGDAIAKRFRSEMMDSSFKTPVFKEEFDKILDTMERFKGTGRMTLKKADELKQMLQKEAQRDYNAATRTYSFAGEMRMKAAKVVRQEIEDVAAHTAVTTGKVGALERFTEGNRLYGSMSEAEKLIEQGIARKQGNRNFSLTDNIQGAGALAGAMASGAAFAPAALGATAVGAAHKYVRERGNAIAAQFANKMSKLAWVKEMTAKASGKVDGAIDEAVKAIASAGNRARIATSIETPKILHTVSFAPEKTVAKNDDQAFKDRVKEIADLAANPELLAQRLSQSTPQIEGAAPNISKALNATATTAAAFLHDKAPKNPNTPMGLGAGTWRPARSEIDTFSRYVAAVTDPTSVIRDLKRGTLTPEGAEALRAVYPAMYNKMVSRIVEELSTHAEKIDYRDKVQLSILTGTPLDETLTPEYAAAVAQAFRSNPPPQQQPRPSSKPAKPASQVAMTATQRIQAGSP